MATWELVYESPSGVVWPLMGATPPRGVFVKEGTVPVLWPSRPETVVKAAGLSGQRLADFQAGFDPMSVEFTVVVDGSMVGKSMGAVLAEWLGSWSTTVPGVLTARVGDGEPRTLGVRLVADFTPGMPEVQPDDVGFMELPMRLVCDRGVAVVTREYVGGATVVNDGVDWVWPRVTWSAAGSLVMPSGAAVQLPPVSAVRVLNFDPWLGGEVTDVDGVRDVSLWRSLRGTVFEGVPPGASGVFRIPGGARMVCDFSVLGWF
ncbi:hypothetical protein HMPREF1219_00168 [Corynebacterium pyruviciproducens ATCC BAA-1742]|uniref:Uncharacterized protein n=1 Tax=Corynebacterium pyruviciproducens ATCC BAA-1742 TaxID=1125779 RepID=S2Z299_9CORY|nr:hypothetical protein [Corynebacterium pyruviciproducens]EPD70873.1 hypothetical protein HMPREF1219_00168 [Corynebacterium pyruviciproducens ATCC BAA-1742]